MILMQFHKIPVFYSNLKESLIQKFFCTQNSVLSTLGLKTSDIQITKIVMVNSIDTHLRPQIYSPPHNTNF